MYVQPTNSCQFSAKNTYLSQAEKALTRGDKNKFLSYHYEAKGGWNTPERLAQTQYYDQIKNEYAKSHNIPLKRIPYWDYDKITLENIMSDKWLINN